MTPVDCMALQYEYQDFADLCLSFSLQVKNLSLIDRLQLF